MLRDLLKNPNIRQFMSYFCVGGISSVTEWVLFSVFANAFNIQYLVATVLAVIFSTTVNWFLGRRFTFKDNARFVDKPVREAIIIFIVAAVGLLFNLVLMFLFVDVLLLNTKVLKTLSKVASTGIVFMYNFLIRKLVIYR